MGPLGNVCKKGVNDLKQKNVEKVSQEVTGFTANGGF